VYTRQGENPVGVSLSFASMGFVAAEVPRLHDYTTITLGNVVDTIDRWSHIMQVKMNAENKFLF